MEKVVLQAADLDGYLTAADSEAIARVGKLYGRALADFACLDSGEAAERGRAEERLLSVFNELGERMQAVVAAEKRIHVYSLETPEFIHGEASRLVAKLRDERTGNPEFIYYIQRAYEMLFNLAFAGPHCGERHPIFVRTPVTVPQANYAVHKIPDIDAMTDNSVMCVMLRAALLPSMIVAKEIQEYSSRHTVTPFALFKISRDDSRSERRHGLRPGPEKILFPYRRTAGARPFLRRPDERHRRQPGDGDPVSARPGRRGRVPSVSSTWSPR